ncbi:uncharacterized protein A4U43_C05F30300 [Asparagus officinalis]|uniref:Fumarylacetoacetase n=1 Tax=Asparagus officinalis TaxID=4686 RepID=A0A5P1EW81_ASPOF|nr:uncharacterized protein A4U43_C05F30300 [Asparagus officinalis]
MALKSFVEVSADSHFPLENLPFGVFRPKPAASTAAADPLPPRPGVAIGDFVLDLSAVASAGLFDGPILKNSQCFFQTSLNMFVEMGRPAWREARTTIQKLLSADEPTLRDNDSLRDEALLPMIEVQMLLPTVIGDYTDFFSCLHHHKNCLTIFGEMENGIPPNWENWFHLPMGYHGRASTVVISGTDIIRPRGQGHPRGNSPPYFGPTHKLDFELEMAAIVGPGNELGKPVDINQAADHIFGLVLMNDWSARDMIAWEYVPLGPFLGKSFSTTVSPWIVTLDALEPFACDAPEQDPESFGCFTELSRNGQKPLTLTNGSERKFLEDGDEVILTACCKGKGYNVGFGTCTGKVLPATP